MLTGGRRGGAYKKMAQTCHVSTSSALSLRREKSRQIFIDPPADRIQYQCISTNTAQLIVYSISLTLTRQLPSNFITSLSSRPFLFFLYLITLLYNRQASQSVQLRVAESHCCAYVRGSCCIPLPGVDFAFVLCGEMGGDGRALCESTRRQIRFRRSEQCFHQME